MTDRELLDHAALRDLVMRYCRGIDRRDFALVRACYHDDAIDDHGGMFHGSADDYVVWVAEVLKSKTFDWAPYLPSLAPPAPPVAVDISVPPGRSEITTHRIIRDTLLARRVKQLHNFKCQLCGHSIVLADGSRYAEAHHIQPLGEPHNGPDILETIVCLCPNHHVELDYGTKALALSELRAVQGHILAEKYIKYHNEHVRRGA